MRFSVASAKAEGVPEALAGRVKIEKCDFGGSFVMDIPPVIKLTPKTGKNSDGETVVLKSPTTGNTYYKRTVFLPFKANGQEYYTATNSPHIYALIREIPVKEEKETDKGVKWIFLDDVLEGTLRFTKKPYEYGSKGTKPVDTLEEVL